MTHSDQRKDKRPAGSTGKNAQLDRDVQARIGEGLRAMYDDIVRQGVPDRFAELLAKLDRQGGRKDTGTEDDSRHK